MPALTASLERTLDHATLGEWWTSLEASAPARFFLSWPFLGTWLAETQLAPQVAVVREDRQIVALALLLPRTVRRRGWLSARAWHLNSSGDPALDCVAIEYNGVLAASEAAARACLQLLRDQDWEELHCPGVGEDFARLLGDLGLDQHASRRQRSVAARLDQPSAVSPNTRYQIRRSLRIYEERGPVRLTAAATTKEALGFLDALGELHQAYWTGRGKPGAFAEPFFRRFHRALIARHFDCVELLRVDAADIPIGYLYNFIWRGRVYSYQSGFRYEADGRLKPGMVCHHLAMERHGAAGRLAYDFLAGDSRFKRGFANGVETLDCWTVAKPHPLIRLENRVKKMLIQRPAGNSSV